MEQELRLIEMINRAIAHGKLKDTKYRPIAVGRIPIDRELGYRSKLDRRPEFLNEMREYGNARARFFLKERKGRFYAMRAVGVYESDNVAENPTSKF
jgi:NTE family protein